MGICIPDVIIASNATFVIMTDASIARGNNGASAHTHFFPMKMACRFSFSPRTATIWKIRLQDRTGAEAAIIAALSDVLPECEPFSRSVFAGLIAVDGDKLLSFDGVDRVAFGWQDITTVAAFYGQQHYDETRCLTISHRRGTAIFLAETHSVWHPFLDGLETRLERVVPRQKWLKTLDEDRSRSVPLFKRSRF